MLPVEILNLLLRHSQELLLNVTPIALLIVSLHPDQPEKGKNKNGADGSQIETVTDRVIGTIPGEIRPGGNKTTHVAEHDVQADAAGSGSVRDDIGADLGVGHGPHGEDGRGEEEEGSVASVGVGGGEKDGVASNDQGCAGHHDDLAPVKLPAESGKEQGEEAADNVRRDREQLLLDQRLVGVNGPHDGGSEKGEALDSDVIEKEDERGEHGDGVQDALDDLLLVNLVEHLGGGDALRLDTGCGEVLLLLSEPSGSLGTVGEREEGEE